MIIWKQKDKKDCDPIKNRSQRIFKIKNKEKSTPGIVLSFYRKRPMHKINFYFYTFTKEIKGGNTDL